MFLYGVVCREYDVDIEVVDYIFERLIETVVADIRQATYVSLESVAPMILDA